MKVCVLGLWHLGTVTAACLASAGHTVVGLDFDGATAESLRAGRPPLFEPGLEDLLKRGLAGGRLSFTTNAAAALDGAEVVWVAYDTPVDEEDRADVEFVFERVTRLFPHLKPGTLILISSQLPVGTTRRLQDAYAKTSPRAGLCFGYSPENLRLGKAISVFTEPDRVVVGLRTFGDTLPVESYRARAADLLRPFTERIEWMSVESAEMTKHALNAFLATSVTFINEVAVLCEQVGADAGEVERGLKSEARIGPRAYLGPGGAFAGGTLARDINFLERVGAEHHQPTHLLSAVRASNDAHKRWAHNKLQTLLGGEMGGKIIAVWGLAYKAGTDTLRRSSSVELCLWLAGRGAQVLAHDPAVKALPGDLNGKFKLCSTPAETLQGASALVVTTAGEEYRTVTAETLGSSMRDPIVIDPNRFLAATLGGDPHVRYVTVGRPLH